MDCLVCEPLSVHCELDFGALPLRLASCRDYYGVIVMRVVWDRIAVRSEARARGFQASETQFEMRSLGLPHIIRPSSRRPRIDPPRPEPCRRAPQVSPLRSVIRS